MKINKERWLKMRISSMDKRAVGKLTDINHIENFSDSILEIYEIVLFGEEAFTGIVGRGYAEEYKITSWADDKMLKNKDGLPLDIMAYKKYDRDGYYMEGMFTWEPFVEYEIRKKFLEGGEEIANYSFGYIDGRRHHCGHFSSPPRMENNSHPWYTMWQEINRKPIEPLKQEMDIESRENK